MPAIDAMRARRDDRFLLRQAYDANVEEAPNQQPERAGDEREQDGQRVDVGRLWTQVEDPSTRR